MIYGFGQQLKYLNGIAIGRLKYHVEQSRNHENDSYAERSPAHRLLNDTESADDDQAKEHAKKTAHVDGGSTDAREQEPARYTPNEVTA